MDVKSLQKILDGLRADIHTLDSKIVLIAQKLKTIERNEEVIGRTIVMHNEKIKKLEERAESWNGKRISGDIKIEVEELKKEIKEIKEKISEMKYVLDSINPLEFATIYQVKDMLKEVKEELGKRQ